MIALYIILGFIAVVLVLLLSSVTVKSSVNDSVYVKVGFLFYQKTVVPKPEKQTENESSDQEIKKPNKIRELIDKKGLVATIHELAGIVKDILISSGKTVKHIRVKRFICVVTAASSDPHKTALMYGEASAVVFPLLRGLLELMKWNIRKTKVLVESDFSGDKPRIEIDFKVKLRLFYIVKAAFGVLLSLLKKKIRQTMKNNTVNTQNLNNKKGI